MKGFSFRGDPRISGWQRDSLKEFCSALDGDIVNLAMRFGLKVFEEDMLPYERGYLVNRPACGSSSGWIVVINKDDRAETRNFTVAHELGHFVLHKAHLAGRDEFDGRLNRNTASVEDPFTYLEIRDKLLESEANAFAAVLLMPPNLFKPAFDRLNGDVKSLAKLFFLSEATVKRRIVELDL